MQKTENMVSLCCYYDRNFGVVMNEIIIKCCSNHIDLKEQNHEFYR